MTFTESFGSKTFVVVDPDARIRRDDDLMTFVSAAGGGFQTIPKGTKVKIVEVKIVETGNFLTPPPTHAGGQEESLTNGSFRASRPVDEVPWLSLPPSLKGWHGRNRPARRMPGARIQRAPKPY